MTRLTSEIPTTTSSAATPGGWLRRAQALRSPTKSCLSLAEPWVLIAFCESLRRGAYGS